MNYEDLVDRLEGASASVSDTESTSPKAESSGGPHGSGDRRRIVTLPDGSVDHCYRVRGLEGNRLESREAFARQLLEGDGDTFSLEPIAVRPGGQAVNAARQIHALGDEAVLVGHLDHPVLADLPFETHSMGEPARIQLFSFEDEEVLFAEVGTVGESISAGADERDGDGDDPIDDWGLETLASVVDPSLVTDADALCCTNWTTYHGLEDVFSYLESEASARMPVVLDPGAIGGDDDEAIAGLCETLSSAESAVDVVLSVNMAELTSLSTVIGVSGDGSIDDGDRSADAVATDDLESRLEAVRSALEITAVVCHGTDVAAAATAAGTHEIPMLSVDDVTLTTGAGDRFSAGLTVGLARECAWHSALALANACSAHFVETGETADASALASFVGARDR